MAVVSDLLASVIDETTETRFQCQSLTGGLCKADSFEAQLSSFCLMARIDAPLSKDQLLLTLDRYIAAIDELLNKQVNSIIHHPRFQKLEASWRGLLYLTEQSYEVSKVKVQVLNVSWSQLIKDFERAIDFDQSHIFRKVYNEEFGMSGGQPYGVLLGDYEIRHRVGGGYHHDDLFALQEMSQVAAAAFAPFIVGASPWLFGLERFSGLGLPLNFEAIFEQAEYTKWNSFREMSDSKFVGVTVPKILMRLPYTSDNYRHDGFIFHEEVTNPDGTGYLWGNACYAYGAVLVRAFAQSSWFTDICGSGSGVDGGGVVSNLPLESYATDSSGTLNKVATDVLITDGLEKALSDYGFMSLCHSKGTQYAVFYSNPSIHKAPAYESLLAQVNARMSSMFHYMLCTSRFAHYIKIMMREKIGSFASAEDVQKYLSTWLRKYVMNNPDASAELRAKNPLAEGRVEVKEVVGKAGVYSCAIYLKPHMQYDQMVSAVKLVTELAETRI
ncbi:MAG: type VI secretion system contractile sheath large subunit [Gammaproteobacteria bacterium]|nr:type VI secretion system contractile sheath large subunit [Gammaproteobacteria bacterium]